MAWHGGWATAAHVGAPQRRKAPPGPTQPARRKTVVGVSEGPGLLCRRRGCGGADVECLLVPVAPDTDGTPLRRCLRTPQSRPPPRSGVGGAAGARPLRSLRSHRRGPGVTAGVTDHERVRHRHTPGRRPRPASPSDSGGSSGFGVRSF